MVARPKRGRKRHVQQDLFRHGGNRKGGGRRPRGRRTGSPHKKRRTVRPYHALQVVMRVVPAVGNLRRRSIYKALREASITAALRERFRIIHLSIQRTHVHMPAEAEHEHALARGMQGFQISAAKHINAALGGRAGRRRRGQVFADRYHVEVITSPKGTRHALSYVLCNWRKHREDQAGLANTWRIAPFSSGILFPDWQELDGKAMMWAIRSAYDPLVVLRPQCWLLREGWKAYGLIGTDEIPSRPR